jgi:RNA polymerase sigma-70 factor (ECF subfamily)
MPSLRPWEQASVTSSELDFPGLYDAFQARLSRYLTHLVGEAEAEDLTQEVFIKVSRSLGSFRGESQLSTWLYRIATNAAIDRMRSPSFRGEVVLDGLDLSDEMDVRDAWSGEEAPTLEQQLMRKEMYECFLDYVKRLPPNYRTVVVLSELEQLPNDEIAGILGISVDMVKIRLHRGRKRLLQELKDHCKAEDWL